MEDLLPRDNNWRTVAPLFARNREPFGKELLKKYLLMLQGTRHRFDDLLQHTFILGDLDRPDVRWIDWGKPATRLDLTSLDYAVISHFAALAALLLSIDDGPQVWSAMVSAAGSIGNHQERDFAEKLLGSVRKYYLINAVGMSAEIIRPRWEKFFELSDTLESRGHQG